MQNAIEEQEKEEQENKLPDEGTVTQPTQKPKPKPAPKTPTSKPKLHKPPEQLSIKKADNPEKRH